VGNIRPGTRASVFPRLALYWLWSVAKVALEGLNKEGNAWQPPECSLNYAECSLTDAECCLNDAESSHDGA